MQLKDRDREAGPGRHDPNQDTNFLTVVVIAMACWIAFMYITFPRHDQSAATEPGAAASPSTSGAGPGAPPSLPPASPGGSQPR